jgi:chromosome segregation ATPase
MRLQKAGSELNELRQRYPALTADNDELKRRLQELSQKFEIEINSRVSAYDQRSAAMQRENEELRVRMQELEAFARRNPEY